MARGGSRPHTPEVQLRRLCLVCAASLLVASAGAATVVAYRGYEYRVLDGTAPTAPFDFANGCQNYYLALPAGVWSLAEDNADAVAVTAADQYDWGTSCMVFANGRSVWRNSGGTCRSSGALSQAGNRYKVTRCYSRILLRRPCAAGGFHGASMMTYAEASTATCTSCTAGTYSSAGAWRSVIVCFCVCVCVFVLVCVCVCV